MLTRRAILGAALAVFSASNPTVSPFTGFYKDPEHLEGYRTIKADNYMGTLQVRGRRILPTGSEFVLDGEIISQFDAVIDFSPKGGRNVWRRGSDCYRAAGQYLKFPDDGNAWARFSDKPDPNVMAEIERDRIANRPMSARHAVGLRDGLDGGFVGRQLFGVRCGAKPAPSVKHRLRGTGNQRRSMRQSGVTSRLRNEKNGFNMPRHRRTARPSARRRRPGGLAKNERGAAKRRATERREP